MPYCSIDIVFWGLIEFVLIASAVYVGGFQRGTNRPVPGRRYALLIGRKRVEIGSSVAEWGRAWADFYIGARNGVPLST